MGSVKIVESVERDGDASISTIEYEFSDSVDFLAWEADRAERTNAAVKSFANAMYSDPEGPMTGEIKVKKKETKH